MDIRYCQYHAIDGQQRYRHFRRHLAGNATFNGTLQCDANMNFRMASPQVGQVLVKSDTPAQVGGFNISGISSDGSVNHDFITTRDNGAGDYEVFVFGNANPTAFHHLYNAITVSQSAAGAAYRISALPFVLGDPNNLVLAAATSGRTYLNYRGTGIVFSDGNFTGAQVGAIDNAGNANFSGKVTSYPGFNFGQPQGINLVNQGTLDALDPNNIRLASISDHPSQAGTIQILGYSSDFSRTPSYITCSDSGTIQTTHVSGNFTADSKAFRIPHPLDAKKDLLHGCLEGPEHSVFYRGEARLKKGSATVELPDYFEALTFDDDRTVLLTVIVDDDKPVWSHVTAGRIKGGKFRIYSDNPTATVAWEVKAARRMNVGRLQVVRDRIETATGANA